MPPKRKRDSPLQQVGVSLEYILTSITEKARELGLLNDLTEVGKRLTETLKQFNTLLQQQREFNQLWHGKPENKGKPDRVSSNKLNRLKERLPLAIKAISEEYKSNRMDDLLQHIEEADLVKNKKAKKVYLKSTVVGQLTDKINKQNARSEATYKALSLDELSQLNISTDVPNSDIDKSGKDEVDEDEEKEEALPRVKKLPENVNSYLQPILRTFPEALKYHETWERTKDVEKKTTDLFTAENRKVYFIDMPSRRSADSALKAISTKEKLEYLRLPSILDKKKVASTVSMDFPLSSKRKKKLHTMKSQDFNKYELVDLYWDLTGVKMIDVYNPPDMGVNNTRWTAVPLDRAHQAKIIRREANNTDESGTRVVTSGTVLYALRKWLIYNGAAIKAKIITDQKKFDIRNEMIFMDDDQILENLISLRGLGYLSFLVISTACAVVRTWKRQSYTSAQRAALVTKLRALSLATTVLCSLLVGHNSFVKTIRTTLETQFQSALHYLQLTADGSLYDEKGQIVLLYSISTEMDARNNEDDNMRVLRHNENMTQYQEDDLFKVVETLRKRGTWVSKILLVMLSCGCRGIEVMSVADFYIPPKEDTQLYLNSQTGKAVGAIKQRGIAKHKVDRIDDRNERRHKRFQMAEAPQMVSASGVDAYKKTTQEKEQDFQSDAVIPSKPVIFGVKPVEVVKWVYEVIRPNLQYHIREQEKAENLKSNEPENRRLYPIDQNGWPNLKEISNNRVSKLMNKIINNEMDLSFPGMSRLRELLPAGHPLKSPSLHIFNSHECRKIYANYSYDNFKGAAMSRPAWISKVLGHSDQSLVTALSYGVANITPSTLVFNQNSDPALRQAASKQLDDLEKKYETLSNTVKDVEMNCCDGESSSGYNLPTIKAVRNKKQTDVQVFERVQRFIDEEWIPAAKKLGLTARPTWKDLLRARMSPKTLSRWAKVRRSREME
jgi:hypothetical protein